MNSRDWISQKKNEYAKREARLREQRRKTFAAEAELDAHDWAWWAAEAKRTKTDWLSLVQQRLRVLQWVKDGRPPLSRWLGRRTR